MISASNDLQNIFKQQYSVKTSLGCDIEYNMNSLIDGISVTSATPDTTYTNAISKWPSNKANPFKKLFPVDSIIKPFRPSGSGIKYFVLLPNDTTSQSFSAYRTVQYPGTQPRIYYPGVTTYYKYWLSAKDTNVDLTVTYKQSSSPYTGNKPALANKIIIKFEKYHVLPTNYTVTITKSDNSTTTIGPSSPSSDGVIVLYYTGSAWTTTDNSNTVGSVTPVSIKSIRLQATNPGGGKVVGVIEISARWVKDISSDVESLTINKDSSASSEDILPVGTITASSLSLNISKYNESSLQILGYNRDITSFNPSLIYLAKNVELRPYFKVFHSNGALGTNPDKYDKVNQGSFYINEFNTGEYSNSTINALDSAKYLMETFCPDILCESYPVTAILRRLLDSIGFTSYNFNLASPETSVPQLAYWWTEDTKTVWQAIQELCRDIQMNAVFDENSVLQFYSRDYMYSTSRSSVWNFYQEKEGTTLPNIIDFSQKEIPSGNYVKVTWNTPIVSNYTGDAEKLWDSPQKYLSAGGLKNSITSTDLELQLDFKVIADTFTQDAFYSFEGYFLVDSEIIEFDAIGYDCTLLNGTKEHNWITSEADINKYRYLCKPGYADVNDTSTGYFRPSGRYRLKTRGALGTTAAAHDPANEKVKLWTGRKVFWP